MCESPAPLPCPYMTGCADFFSFQVATAQSGKQVLYILTENPRNREKRPVYRCQIERAVHRIVHLGFIYLNGFHAIHLRFI